MVVVRCAAKYDILLTSIHDTRGFISAPRRGGNLTGDSYLFFICCLFAESKFRLASPFSPHKFHKKNPFLLSQKISFRHTAARVYRRIIATYLSISITTPHITVNYPIRRAL
jgi:hypothetical protein